MIIKGLYAATLALYLVAALSKSSLFSAKSDRSGCWASAFCSELITSLDAGSQASKLRQGLHTLSAPRSPSQ